MIDFLCQIKILLLNMLKLLKNSGFFLSKFSNFRFQGKVATLLHKKNMGKQLQTIYLQVFLD